MFKIEGVKIVCPSFLSSRERKAQVKDSQTGLGRCPGKQLLFPLPPPHQHFELFLENEDQEAFSMATTEAVPVAHSLSSSPQRSPHISLNDKSPLRQSLGSRTAAIYAFESPCSLPTD